MAGTCNSVRCLPTSALSRAEVTGDFRGSLMRRSSKVRSTRRRDCGDYQAAAWTTCSAAELNRRPRYKRAMLALWLMTALGQTRKSGDAIATSALLPTTDFPACGCDVRKVPQPDSCTAAKQGPLLTRASSAQLARGIYAIRLRLMKPVLLIWSQVILTYVN